MRSSGGARAPFRIRSVQASAAPACRKTSRAPSGRLALLAVPGVVKGAAVGDVEDGRDAVVTKRPRPLESGATALSVTRAGAIIAVRTPPRRAGRARPSHADRAASGARRVEPPLPPAHGGHQRFTPSCSRPARGDRRPTRLQASRSWGRAALVHAELGEPAGAPRGSVVPGRSRRSAPRAGVPRARGAPRVRVGGYRYSATARTSSSRRDARSEAIVHERSASRAARVDVLSQRPRYRRDAWSSRCAMTPAPGRNPSLPPRTRLSRGLR